MVPASSTSSGSISTTPPAATAAATASATLATPKYTCQPGVQCALRVRRHGGDPGHLGAVHHQRGVGPAVVLRVLGDLMAEQLLEESDGGLRLRGEQLRPGQGAGLLGPGGAEVRPGLPGAGGAAAGRGKEDHHARVPHGLRTELERAVGVGQAVGELARIVGGEVHVPLAAGLRRLPAAGSAGR